MDFAMYSIESEFPLKNPNGKMDCYIAGIVGESFDIYCWMTAPSSKEVQAWKRGWLRYGAFISNDVPFVLLYFPEVKTSLDVSINIHAEREKNRPYQG